MQISDLAARLHARRSGSGYIARCPAHGDRSPSLSISNGRDGRILLRCHAGCDTFAIVKALGLQVSDLFATDRPAHRSSWSARRPDVVEVERALRDECAAIRAREAQTLGNEPPELARHRNAARTTVERRLGVSLKREGTPWWQVEPFCNDPAWYTCIDQALHVEAACSGLRFETLRTTIATMQQTQHRVLVAARQFQRELAREVA